MRDGLLHSAYLSWVAKPAWRCRSSRRLLAVASVRPIGTRDITPRLQLAAAAHRSHLPASISAVGAPLEGSWEAGGGASGESAQCSIASLNAPTKQVNTPGAKHIDCDGAAAVSCRHGRPSLGSNRDWVDATTRTHLASSETEWHIPDSTLEAIPVPLLFYPGAACDTREPIEIFLSHVTDFWFADIGYSQSRFAERPALAHERRFQHIASEVRLATIAEDQIEGDPYYLREKPFVLTEKYIDRATGAHFQVHRTRRRAPSAMRTEFEKLGVFFHRSDFTEGSSTVWLTAFRRGFGKRCRLVTEIVDKMQSGSLIVTDGSKCEPCEANIYRPLRTAADRLRDVTRPDVSQVAPFLDDRGNCFRCVGYLGRRGCGRALVWTVQKAVQQQS